MTKEEGKRLEAKLKSQQAQLDQYRQEQASAKKNLRDLRAQTLERAQEVITRQMKTAQEIARLLGETTAETKILLVKLMSLFEEEETK